MGRCGHVPVLGRRDESKRQGLRDDVGQVMKRKVVALALAGIFPGLGQLYNREWLKGAAFVVAGLGLSWLLGRALPGDLEALASAAVDASALWALGLLLAVWLWSVVDAWRRA